MGKLIELGRTTYNRKQTAVPVDAIEKAGLKDGDTLLWCYDEDAKKLVVEVGADVFVPKSEQEDLKKDTKELDKK